VEKVRAPTHPPKTSDNESATNCNCWLASCIALAIAEKVSLDGRLVLLFRDAELIDVLARPNLARMFCRTRLASFAVNSIMLTPQSFSGCFDLAFDNAQLRPEFGKDVHFLVLSVL
jgi:hypothetical protein